MRIKTVSFIIIGLFIAGFLNAQTNFSDGLAKGKSSNKKILINVYSESNT